MAITALVWFEDIRKEASLRLECLFSYVVILCLSNLDNQVFACAPEGLWVGDTENILSVCIGC